MNKKIPSLLVAFSIFLANPSIFVMATPEDKIQKNKSIYQQLNNEILSLNSQLATLGNEISSLNEKLKLNNIEINATTTEIANTEVKINAVQEEIKEGEISLGKRIRGMYKSNSTFNKLTYLLTSNNFSDFISRINALNKLTSLDKELIKDLNDKRSDLNNNISELNEKKIQLDELKKSTEENLSNLNSKKQQQSEELDKLNQQKEHVFSIIEANEELLISNPISVINSSSSESAIQSAINTLKSLIPQLNSKNVISKANQAIDLGTSKITPKPNGTITENKEYKATYTMTATAYYGHEITAMGLKPVRDPNGLSTIAVDRKVIPLGTKVYIPGYGYAIASDTGGAIKGNKIDLFMNSKSECYSWGRRTVTLHVIAYPGEW